MSTPKRGPRISEGIDVPGAARYPNAHPAGTTHEAYDEESSRRALEAARKILEYAEKVIRCGG
ncbi:hypothetical protein [Infirmifilum sp. NZ]|uniref:hypothetical protein n=1 Tax=Infirmifilum sp. NZ TaxID=2926850 RepID=UPI0027A5DDF0|nr:hypothetical protein [Infirmifilum sp. NZ]UNQ73184.1 hypothetical protein MOV14_08740 [Infirmifilum sp. NZ]